MNQAATKERERTISALVRQDTDSACLPPLNSLSNRLREPKRHRVADASVVLESTPQGTEATYLFMRELLTHSPKQVAGHVSLGPTFIRTVESLRKSTFDALPTPQARALSVLKRMAKEQPIPIPRGDPSWLAQAMAQDGALRQMSGWSDSAR